MVLRGTRMPDMGTRHGQEGVAVLFGEGEGSAEDSVDGVFGGLEVAHDQFVSGLSSSWLITAVPASSDCATTWT